MVSYWFAISHGSRFCHSPTFKFVPKVPEKAPNDQLRGYLESSGNQSGFVGSFSVNLSAYIKNETAKVL